MASTLKGYSKHIFSTSHRSQQVPKLAKVSGIGSTTFSSYLASSSMLEVWNNGLQAGKPTRPSMA